MAGQAAWVVHTARNGSTLPGQVVRSAGDAESGDPAVDEAADGVTATLSTYADAFARSSYDGNSAQVVLTVHYEQNYDNAFWNGTQLVFGDGDGTVFGRFTTPIDVLGHEFTHAVTQFTAGLDYQGQPGALNESVSDCFGMCVKQRALGQTADQADWLVGEGIFLPGVEARALRDMAHPGTAYDDSTLGRDPQVGDMADYVDTSDDNGGVHINSGIPNRAFYLAATVDRRRHLGGRRPDLVRRADRWPGHQRHRLRRLRGGDGGSRGRARRHRPPGLGDRRGRSRRVHVRVATGRRRVGEAASSRVRAYRRGRRPHGRGRGRPGLRRRARRDGPRPRRPARPGDARVGATRSRTRSATPSRWAAARSPCRNST